MTKEIIDKIIDLNKELATMIQDIRLDIYSSKNPTEKLEEAIYHVELLYKLLFELYEIYEGDEN